MASKKRPSKQSKLSKCLKAPIRLLIRAKDFYIKSITGYSDHLASYGTVVSTGPTTQPVDIMPRSLSANSTKSTHFEDDYRELLRAASTRSLRDKAASDQVISIWSQKSPRNNNMPRSHSVAIGRIDEDAPLIDFGDGVKVKHVDVFPRSRSYAISNKTTTTTLSLI